MALTSTYNKKADKQTEATPFDRIADNDVFKTIFDGSLSPGQKAGRLTEIFKEAAGLDSLREFHLFWQQERATIAAQQVKALRGDTAEKDAAKAMVNTVNKGMFAAYTIVNSAMKASGLAEQTGQAIVRDVSRVFSEFERACGTQVQPVIELDSALMVRRPVKLRTLG